MRHSIKLARNKLMACGLAFLAAVSVGPAVAGPRDTFPRGYPVVLGFDLRDDHHLTAAVIINASDSLRSGDANVILPFPIAEIEPNERVLFRVGQYDAWSLITYSTTRQEWPQQLTFKPILDSIPDGFSGELSDLTGNVYLQIEGQRHHFYYRYVTDATRDVASNAADVTPVQKFDAIAFLLPGGSVDRAVRPTGQLTIPERLQNRPHTADHVFPGEPNQNQLFLEIAYEAPPTLAQRSFIRYATKYGLMLLEGLAPFLITILFIPRGKIRRPALRRWSLRVGVVVLVLALSALVWLAIQLGDTGEDVFLHVLTLATSSIASFILYMVKAEEA